MVTVPGLSEKKNLQKVMDEDKHTVIFDLDGQITEYEIHPEDFGMPMVSNRALRVETPEESQAVLRSVLNNEVGAARDIVILNAGAALYAANVAASIKEGIALAREAIASGAAQKKMEQFVTFTQKSGSAS